MKKIILLLTVISVIAFQSCKKDEITNPEKSNEKTNISSAFNPNKIDDMNKYLSDFVKNMKSVTRDNTSSLSLEEAEWHLTASLNYQHCNANTLSRNMEYDTIISYINVDNDNILLADISSSFAEISKEVQSIYNSYNFEDKQILYIYSTIDRNNNTRGQSVVRTIMSTANNDHFYFNDWDYACIDTLFPYDERYNWRDAADSLAKYMKYIAERNIGETYSYYVSIQNFEYIYSDYIISPSISQDGWSYNSRLFNIRTENPNTFTLSGGNMAFYFDSYLGLVCREYRANGLFIDAIITCNEELLTGRLPYRLSHQLTGIFGTIIFDDNNVPSV